MQQEDGYYNIMQDFDKLIDPYLGPPDAEQQNTPISDRISRSNFIQDEPPNRFRDIEEPS